MRLFVKLIDWAARHWLLAFGLVFAAWVTPAFLAPLLVALGAGSAGSAIFHVYHLACHQRADRSSTLMGHQVAVCERCQAIYLSLLGATLVYRLFGSRLRPFSSWWLVPILLPMAIDGGGQLLGLWESDLVRRTLTGGLAGLGVGLYALTNLGPVMAMVGSRSDVGWGGRSHAAAE